MTKRKSLSPKVRFEVFKRDSFKCQYCGAVAPDVLLEVDHIKPVVAGGNNKITNLITACKSCNIGKGATPLDDKAAISKQYKQMEELNERRLQLEMMVEWHEGLQSVKEASVDAVVRYFNKATGGYEATELGKKIIKKLLCTYDVAIILESIDTAVEWYATYDNDGDTITRESVSKVFDKIKNVCSLKVQEAEKPYITDLMYIRGILKNRFGFPTTGPDGEVEYIWSVVPFLENLYHRGIPVDVIKTAAIQANSYADFALDVCLFVPQQEVSQ